MDPVTLALMLALAGGLAACGKSQAPETVWHPDAVPSSNPPPQNNNCDAPNHWDNSTPPICKGPIVYGIPGSPPSPTPEPSPTPKEDEDAK